MRKKDIVLVLVILIAASVFAAEISLDDVVNKIQGNQEKVTDMYAETVTTITSNMAVPGQGSKGPQKMIQKSKMWTKGADKSKVEMISPMKQITITNGDQMAIINSETGQKMVQDINKLRGQGGEGARDPGKMSLDKAKEFFDLKVRKLDALKPEELETYVITGIPKKENKFIGKMEFCVDAEKWVPVKILMYDAKGKLISQSDIEYAEVSDLWVPVKNISSITTPMGTMKVEMEYTNIKVNKGIKDSEFNVNE